VPTFGWDVVYAVRIPRLNAHIAERAQPARAMEAFVADMSVTASIGNWRIVQGGSAYLVFLSAEIENGRITPWGKPSMKFAGEAIVAVELQVCQSDRGGAKQAALRISEAGDAADPDVRPLHVRDVSLRGIGNRVVKDVVQKGVEQWLDANPDAIRQVFAAVDLADGLKDQAFSWLRPTSVSYAYCDAPDPGDCLLAVLAMVENRSPEGLDQGVSPHAVPAGCEAAILVSPYILLGGIVRSAAMRAFPGTRESDFLLCSVMPKLALAGERELHPVMKGGLPRRHVLKSFSVAFEGPELVCRTENTVVVEQGVSVTTSMQIAHGLTVERLPGERLRMRFSYLREPRIAHRTDVDEAVAPKDKQIGAADAFMIGGAMLSFFAGPLFFVVLAVEASLLSGRMADATQIDAAMASQAPGLDLLASYAAAPCVWLDGLVFSTQTADLAGCLRLGGNLRQGR
jgi:hypothetical protein